MLLLPTRTTHFPYTTLFRSFRSAGTHDRPRVHHDRARASDHAVPPRGTEADSEILCTIRRVKVVLVTAASKGISAARSEEHTSELQSRENLVCRLLLEKKNG